MAKTPQKKSVVIARRGPKSAPVAKAAIVKKTPKR
jgi:hypothetical protein